MSERFDLIIRNAFVFDGTGATPEHQDIGIRRGLIASRCPNLAGTAEREIDASGKWTMPGLLDIHTHLDLEVEVNPGLEESVRHGTTTVVVGNCSLGAAFGPQNSDGDNPIIDCFARVENVPKAVLQKCADKMVWDNTADYLKHLDELPLGPNIAPLIPHSMLRIEVMGVDDAVSRDPTPDELEQMKKLLSLAMEQGYVGFSTDGLPFHYLANDPNKFKRIPTQYASFKELKALTHIVRRHDRVWQATPDSHDRLKTFRWFALTSGRLYGKPLKTSALAALDVVADPNAWKMFLRLSRLYNSALLRGQFHFQALSTPFVIFGDGITTPAFEEVPCICRLIACELDDREGRLAIMNEPGYQETFRAQWHSNVGGLSLKRDLQKMFIERCPIERWNGLEMAALFHRLKAFQAGEDGHDLTEDEQNFLADCPELEVEADFVYHLFRYFDRDVRWWAIAANDRPEIVKKLLFSPYTMPGFNDSGAHLTNLAFFDANLVTLKLAQSDSLARVAQAVARLTREPARFFGLNAGSLELGAQADITIVDPDALALYDSDANRTMVYREIFAEEQLVNRSDGVVADVLIAGVPVWHDGRSLPELGKRKLGQALRYAGSQ